MMNGASLANATTIAVNGMSGNYTPQVGQYLNVMSGGLRFLHVVRGFTRTGGNSGTVAIWPPARKAFANADVLEMQSPRIDGFPQGNVVEWSHDKACTVGLAFMIREAR
jgi:hypothetical protein